MNSQFFEKILKEATYTWELDPSDRSWFIGPGEFWSDVSHRLILKNKFRKEWDKLKSRQMDDSEIEEIFTDRLFKMGFVKIGELKNFYCESKNLNQREKDILQGFCKSWLKVVPEDSIKIMTINGHHNLTLKDVSNDALMRT